MDSSKLLGTQGIGRLLFKFSVPAIIGMVVNALYNIVDSIFIGQYVGTLGLGGVAVSYPIMLVVFAFVMLVGFGATSLISIRLGEDRKEDAEAILGNATVLLVLVPLILLIFIQIFLDTLLISFGASEDILPFARQYLSIVSFGFLFQSIGFGMNNFIRCEGKPILAMITMLIGAFLNIGLDFLFIAKFDMGMQGAALATVLAQVVSATWVMHHFLSGRSLLKIKKENLHLKSKVIKQIASLGFAQFSLQIANSIVALVVNRSLQHYGGDLSISAYRIINNVAMLFLMPVFGVNQGAQAIIGYNYGAKKYDRVKRALMLAIFSATFIVFVGFVVTRMYPRNIIRIFNKDDEALINMTVDGMTIFFTMLPLIGIQIVSSNYFQAIGKPRHSIFLGLLRQVIILIPATLILPTIYGLKGVWIAGPTSDFISCLLTTTLLLKDVKLLNKGSYDL